MSEKKDVYREKWYVMELCESFYINTDDAKNSGSIAEVLHGKSEEAIKRAVLMSAAPELLRLLEVMTAYADRSRQKDPRVYNDDELSEEYDNALREAERVIKKAKGESND